MAKPLQNRPQSLGEFNIPTGHNTVFQQKANNLSALGEVSQDLTDPIAEAIIGGEAQSQRLAKYDLEKDLPVEEIPQPEDEGFNLWSLTKWGKAHDEAYNKLDEELISLQAKKAFQEQALEFSKPENQGPGMTKRWEQAAGQIGKAYVDVASPANRVKLMTKLTETGHHYQFELAKQEQAYVRKQAVSAIEEAFKFKDEERRMAGHMNDPVMVAKLSKEQHDLIRHSQNINLITKAQADARIRELESNNKTSLLTGQYIEAETLGKGPEFLRDVALNPEQFNLNLSEAETLAKNIIQVKNFKDQATQDYYAYQGAQVEADIASGKLSNKVDLLDYDLDPMQVLRYEAAIDRSTRENASKTAKFRQAQIDITAGQSGGIDKSVISQMTDNAWGQTQAELGRPLTLIEKADSIVGGPTAYPASGIDGVGLGTNDPSFDRTVSAALTSTDPQAMINGYDVYQYMHVTRGQPNTLNLSDDALRAAVAMKSLIQAGADPVRSAQKVTTAVLEINETGIKERLDKFSTTMQDRLPSAFKSAIGADPDKNTQIYGMFIDNVRVNYANGLDFDEAVEVTQKTMSNYGTSKYFPPGLVGQLAPEETLPRVALEFDNQLAGAVQEGINNGWSGAGGVPIEWADKSDHIDLNLLDPEDWVDRPLPAVSLGAAKGCIGLQTKLPEIKIGNHKSPVYLIAGQRVRYGDNGRPAYQVGYIDKVGQLQPINDGRGPNLAATFSPVDISIYAPNYLSNLKSEQRKESIRRAAHAPVSKAQGKLLLDLLTLPANIGREVIEGNPLYILNDIKNLENAENKSQRLEDVFTKTLNKGQEP